MLIKKYGIELCRLTEHDIELVRHHRNSEAIRSKMFHQALISKAEQKRWFQSINTSDHYYFLIHYENEAVGLVHGSLVSKKKKITTGGIFIWDPAILQTHIPVVVSLCMTDLTFFILDFKKTIVEVRSDNASAINYNLGLGYKFIEDQETDGKLIMGLSKRDYIVASEKIRNAIKTISKDYSDLQESDIIFPEKLPKEVYANLPLTLQLKYQKQQ